MKVYFNNSCKICKAEIDLYKKQKIQEIDWIDITDNSSAEKEISRTDKELLRRLHVKDGEKVKIEDIELTALHTPGHTICSFSFFMEDRVFTGDTLLINGTGRTDFQGGSAKDQYDSIFNRLLKLPDQTVIYPAHDYNGKKNSTIIEEKKNNPRLQVNSIDEYIEIMKNLKLDKPNMMDFHVSSNIKGLIK